MCLKTVDFALRYNKGTHQFEGQGFKKMALHDIDKYKTWQECKFTKIPFPSTRKKKNVNKTIFSSNYAKTYAPGFHVFLNKDDALNYDVTSFLVPKVVRVAFRNVLAFGSNNVKMGLNWIDGPCVVAREMKVLEVYE